MPKATEASISQMLSPSRRLLFGTGAALALLGSTAAVASPRLPPARPSPAAATPATDPDAGLIAACQEFEALERRYLGLYYGPERIADDDERDEHVDLIRDKQADLEAFIHEVPAGTLAGHQARARLLILENVELALFLAAGSDDPMIGTGGESEMITAALLRDLVGDQWVAEVASLVEEGQ